MGTPQTPIAAGTNQSILSCDLFDLRRGFEESLRKPALFLDWKVALPSARFTDIPIINCPGLSRILALSPENSGRVLLEDFDGASLQTMANGRLVPQSEALAILIRIAEALDALHATGRTHGALQLSSVLVSADLHVRIVDWMAGWNEASVGYLSQATDALTPERIAGAATVPASDQFALGVLAQRLLLGRAPFAAPSLAEKLFRVSHGLWKDSLGGDSGASSSRVYDRVFSVTAADRFPSCSDFVREIETASRQRNYSETRLGDESSVFAPAVREPLLHEEPTVSAPPGRATAWWIAATVAAVLAFGAGLANWLAQSHLDAIAVRSASLGETAPEQARVSRNGQMSVCNTSQSALMIRELAVAYWGPDHKAQVFNSTHYNEPGWNVAPSSRQQIFWTQAGKSVWDGSVLFYFARVRQQQQEYFVSGLWDTGDPKCLDLATPSAGRSSANPE